MINIYCDNKGCGLLQAATLNTETEEVICEKCGKPITNVTRFMKVQLKHAGQVRRNQKSQKAFSVRCHKCNTEGQPILGPDKITLLCSKCNSIFGDNDINRPFRHAIVEFLRTHRAD